MLVFALVLAQQCQTLDQQLDGLLVPHDGATDVPTDVTPFVANSGAVALDDLHVAGVDGVAIPADIQDIPLQFGSSFKRVVPKSPLTAGQPFTISAGGVVLATFNTGSTTATTPGAPDATLADPACVAVAVGVKSGDAALFIADVNGQPELGGQVTLGGVVDAASGAPLEVFASAGVAGEATANVAAVDFAGNVSASTPVKVSFPPPRLEDCSSSGGAPWIIALACVAVRRLRRGATTTLRLSALSR